MSDLENDVFVDTQDQNDIDEMGFDVESDDEDYLPLNKIRSKSRKRNSNKTQNQKRKKEKENNTERRSANIKVETTDMKIYQESTARRVAMVDPLRETNIGVGVFVVPTNVQKVKLVISCKKQKVAQNNLEHTNQVKEELPPIIETPDELSFLDEDDVPLQSIKGQRKKKFLTEKTSVGTRNIPRRRAAPKSFNEIEEDSLNGLEASKFFLQAETEDLELKQEDPEVAGDNEDYLLERDQAPELPEEVDNNDSIDGNEFQEQTEGIWDQCNSDDNSLELEPEEPRFNLDEAKFLNDYVVPEQIRKRKRKKRLLNAPDDVTKEDSDNQAFIDPVLEKTEDWEDDRKIIEHLEGEVQLPELPKAKLKSNKEKLKSQPDRKIYGCMFCDYMGRKQAWLTHLKVEHSEKNLVFCTYNKICQMPFENQLQLQSHLEATHEKQIICNFEDCGRIFRKRANLREHRRIHFRDGNDPEDPEKKFKLKATDRAYVCNFCGKKYRTRNGFRAHEAMVHTRKLNHKCPFEGCTSAFFYYSELSIHTRKHTGELPFTCSYCGARYISHATLAQHERAAHLQTEDTQCHICNKKLRKRNLPGHLKTHEGYEGIPCTVCGKEFPTIGGKSRHEKIHFEVKQHTCRFCGKSFVQRANMVAHERIHTGERPYKCKHCNEGFPQQTRRNQHEQTCKHKVIQYNQSQQNM